jgi:DNA polymerase I
MVYDASMARSKAPRMLLVDATGLIFRAYYSITTAMNRPSDGQAVNAVYGVTRMLLKLFRDEPAAASALVFDAGRRTFRNELYPDYKAHREEPPADMRLQFGLTIDMARTTGAPVFVREGFEADDIIATLVVQARARGLACTVLTGDRDLFQLIADDVDIVLPGKRGEFERVDTAAFDFKYGFPRDRFVDFKALMGDPSDNIPGLQGIGEKTAAKLVSTYGKLEQIYGNIDLVKPPSVKDKLKAGREDVFLFRQLVTLNHEVPELYDFAGRTLPDFANAEFQQYLTDLGFGRVREDAAELGDLQANQD